jgi:hypothetical protein
MKPDGIARGIAMQSIFEIFFLDIPSLIDSTWRRIDLWANAERSYVLGTPAKLERRRFWNMPPFWMFAILVFFVSYGPNWAGLCAMAPAPVVKVLRCGLALVIAGATVRLAWRLRKRPGELVTRRFARLRELNHVVCPLRERIVFAGAWITAAFPVVLVLIAASRVAGWWTDPFTCAVEGWDWLAFFQFALCVVAVALIAVLSLFLTSTKRLLCAQIWTIILVAGVHWFLLAEPSTREISDLPYRHVFAFWAPCIVAVLLLAPLLVKLIFPLPGSKVPKRAAPVPETTATSPHQAGPATATASTHPNDLEDPNDLEKESGRFKAWLAVTELFDNRVEPVLSFRRLLFALIHGPFYHPLHLLLIPALVGLVAPPQWLYLFVSLALLFSALLLVWGNVSSRWEEMNIHVDRWFLRGAPRIVSFLVIGLAILRVLQFDYVSTILDALSFGTIFGLVVMTYVLFWFVEYWINRVLAVRLLRILGPGTDELATAYPRTPPVACDIRVAAQDRFVVSHGTGRFIAIGTSLPPPSLPAQVAFNSFYFREVFCRLSEWAATANESTYPEDIERRIGNYFFSLNIAMVAVTALFLVYFIANHWYWHDGIDPVLTTTVSPAPAASVDVAALLTQDPREPRRPAIVVVGSGGGTRAALYTATVLRGLHRLGVDRDIALLSGVSGGGVALAYFAANRDALIARDQDDSIPCSENPSAKLRTGSAWNCFENSMTEPFIEDVLNGATEWRVFSQTALSALLAESFERRLFGGRTLGSIGGGPALILNSAIVSHPADDSDLLQRTLDKAPGRTVDNPDCGEEERSYKLLSGSRLIFTDIRDTQMFPKGPARIADVRLLYRIVRDANVPLATAAALNANFPPVFPSARVRVEDGDGGPCRFKDYYVTDGGAVENLGLVSALYALRSAIDQLPPGSKVRPIHIVLAEASAVSYDYGQDRGWAAIEGSRERLAGGLTGTLIAELEQQLAARGTTSAKVEFHYLGLPLAFRARGGFGTHWMYAKTYHLNDPRPRSIPWLNLLPGTQGRDRKASIDQPALRELWLALHNPDPKAPFCGSQKFSTESEKVWKWICGSPDSDPDNRDLQMWEWQKLVAQMRAMSN